MSLALNPSDAEDIMNAQFLAKMQDGEALTLIGYLPVILWGGIEQSKKPDSSKYYVRISHQTVLEKQANLSNCEGIPGQKRYRTSGLTFVQLFCPTSDTNHAAKGLQLATIARNAFRGAMAHAGQDAVWFYNATIKKLPLENDLYRLNVVAEHEYDELG